MKRYPAVLLLILTLLSIQVFAQSQPKPIGLETALGLKWFSEYSPFSISPDGQWVAYALRGDNSGNVNTTGNPYDLFLRTGVRWTAVNARIWIINTKTGQTKKVTEDNDSSWLPRWSPNGRYLAFLSDRASEGKPRMARAWCYDASTGKVSLLADAIVIGWEIEWSRGSDRVLLGLLPENMTLEAYAARMAALKSEEKKKQGSTVTIYRGRSKDEGLDGAVSDGVRLDANSCDLAWIDMGTGKIDRLVRDQSIYQVKLSPDGSRIAYTVPLRSEKLGYQQTLFDLMTIPASGGEARTVASGIRLSYTGGPFSWSPDGSKLAFRTSGMFANGDCFVVDVNGGVPRNVTSGPHREFIDKEARQSPLWDEDGRHIYFEDDSSMWGADVSGGGASELCKLDNQRIRIMPQRGNMLLSPDKGRSTIILTRDKFLGKSCVYRVELGSGKAVKLMDGDKFYGVYGGEYGVEAAIDGSQVVMAVQDVGHAEDLYVLEGEFSRLRKLTSINPELEHYEMGERRIIEWRSVDGVTLHGVLLLPAGYREGKRYPLVTKVYGGSQVVQGSNRFGLESHMANNLQILATRGYAVLLPETKLGEGTVVLDLLKSVMPGVDKVVEMGIADPDRLGVMGHSFGGYNTIALLSETSRFKAGIMVDGDVDMISSYGQLNRDGTTYGLEVIEHGQFLVNSTPWERRDRYIENSPIFYLDRVQTPLLIVHGEEDNAVPVYQSDEAFVGLRRLGKEVVYAKYAGEGHYPGIWSYANKLDYLDRVVDWFDSHIGPAKADARKLGDDVDLAKTQGR